MAMSRVDIERKFRRSVAKLWSDAKQRQVLDCIWDLDQQDSLQEFFALTAIDG